MRQNVTESTITLQRFYRDIAELDWNIRKFMETNRNFTETYGNFSKRIEN